jgi:hypothetical protein
MRNDLFCLVTSGNRDQLFQMQCPCGWPWRPCQSLHPSMWAAYGAGRVTIDPATGATATRYIPVTEATPS